MSIDYKALSRGISRDMSPEAIGRRLEIASELREVAVMLSKARYVGKAEPADAQPPGAPDAGLPPDACP